MSAGFPLTVPGSLRATPRMGPNHLSLHATGRREHAVRAPGPSWGRELAVNSGQSQSQANSHIGRDPAGRPYMACKGQGLIPSTPPGTTHLQVSSLGPLTLCPKWIVSGVGGGRWRGERREGSGSERGRRAAATAGWWGVAMWPGCREASGQTTLRSRRCRQAPPNSLGNSPYRQAIAALARFSPAAGQGH
jgi:hypothetical protein